jgi:hypothetical protein
VSFQLYGCGVIASLGVTLPPDFCGGRLMPRVLLTTPVGQFDGMLTVFCIIGSQSAEQPR